MSYNPCIEGLAAFYNGKGRDMCPYASDDAARASWLEGWDLGAEWQTEVAEAEKIEFPRDMTRLPAELRDRLPPR